MQARQAGEAKAHESMPHAQVSFIYLLVFSRRSANQLRSHKFRLTCHSQCRIEKRKILYDLVHERRGGRGPHGMKKKSKKEHVGPM
jgi:hypothetical protein